MSARDIVGGLAGAAVGAVKHPVGTAGEAVSKARTAVGAGTAVGTAVAGTVIRRVRGDAEAAKEKAAGAAEETAANVKEAAKDKAGSAKQAKDATKQSAKESAMKAAEKTADTTTEAAQTATDKVEDAAKGAAGAAEKATDKAAETAKQTAEKAAAKTVDKTAKKAPAKKSTAKKSPAKKAPAKREPQVVLAEPAPPAEPPIDVVGQALAAEAQDPDNVGFGRTTEPRGASRDEEHGEASLQPAEVNEIAEEMAEVARAGNLDLATPVGTTGADTGFNPDTAEADLQQPGTEPLVDPSLTSEVKSEQETLSNAAEAKKPKPPKKKS